MGVCLVGLAAESGAEKRVQHQGRRAHAGFERACERATGGEVHLVVCFRIAVEFFGSCDKEDIQRLRLVVDQDLSCDGEAVAAVVAFAADDDDALGFSCVAELKLRASGSLPYNR